MAGFRIAADLADDLRPQAASIYYHAFEGKLGAVMKRDGTAERFLADIMKPEFALFATSEAGDQVLGVAGFKTAGGSFSQGSFSQMAFHYGAFGTLWRGTLLQLLERPLQPGELQLDGIAVARGARGMGVGTALINACFEEAERRGLVAIALDVIDENTRARKLYEKLGFEHAGTHNIGIFRHVFGFTISHRMVKKLENTAALDETGNPGRKPDSGS